MWRKAPAKLLNKFFDDKVNLFFVTYVIVCLMTFGTGALAGVDITPVFYSAMGACAGGLAVWADS